MSLYREGYVQLLSCLSRHRSVSSSYCKTNNICHSNVVPNERRHVNHVNVLVHVNVDVDYYFNCPRDGLIAVIIIIIG